MYRDKTPTWYYQAKHIYRYFDLSLDCMFHYFQKSVFKQKYTGDESETNVCLTAAWFPKGIAADLSFKHFLPNNRKQSMFVMALPNVLQMQDSLRGKHATARIAYNFQNHNAFDSRNELKSVSMQ